MTIQYKNAGINLSTTDTTSVLTAPSNAVLLVKQIQIDNAISQKKRMMTLSLLEELRAEQDKEEKLIIQKLKQEKKL